MTELKTGWFGSLWSRVAVALFCIVWAGWEWLVTEDPLWKWIALAAAAVAVWTLVASLDRSKGSGGGSES